MGNSCRGSHKGEGKYMADYPEFKLPNGVDVSELEEGEEMEVLAKIRKGSDGEALLIEVEGYPLVDEEEVEEVEVEETDDEPSFEDAVMIRAEQLG